MKKAIITFLLITTIVGLWSFDNSFIGNSDSGNVSGTSAVIFAKADYVSVRASFYIFPKAGTWANVTFSNGTQINMAWADTFTVFLPKTTSEAGYYYKNAPGEIFLNNAHPFRVAFVSGVSESYFDTLKSFNEGGVTVFWLRIDGAATVRVTEYGVAV